MDFLWEIGVVGLEGWLTDRKREGGRSSSDYPCWFILKLESDYKYGVRCYYNRSSSLGQKVLWGGQGTFEVKRNFLPREVVGGGHGFMSNWWESGPWEWWEATVAGGWWGNGPIIVVRFGVGSEYLAIYNAIGLWIVKVLIFPWSNALPDVVFLIHQQPILQICLGFHFGMVGPEDSCTRIIIIGVGICMDRWLHC